MNTENQIIVQNEHKGLSIDVLNDGGRKEYQSFVPSTEEEKIQLYNALQQCDERLMDHIGEVILLKNVICQEFQRENEETGEVTDEVRTVILDDKGKTYGTASKGIFLSLAQIFKAFGQPSTWKEAKPIRIKEKQTGKNRKTYIIELVTNSEK